MDFNFRYFYLTDRFYTILLEGNFMLYFSVTFLLLIVDDDGSKHLLLIIFFSSILEKNL